MTGTGNASTLTRTAVWFVQHEDSVPSADKKLPVFQITQLEDQIGDHVGDLVGDGTRGMGEGVGGFSVRVEQQQLPLREVVVVLLAGRIQFPEAGGVQPGRPWRRTGRRRASRSRSSTPWTARA